MRENYQLVLGREEEQVLRREIWAVTLSAWIFMVMAYLLLQPAALYLTTVPSSSANKLVENSAVILFIAGFTVFKRILSLVFWCCAPTESGSRFRSNRQTVLLRRMCHDILWTLLSVVLTYGTMQCLHFVQIGFMMRQIQDPGEWSQILYHVWFATFFLHAVTYIYSPISNSPIPYSYSPISNYSRNQSDHWSTDILNHLPRTLTPIPFPLLTRSS